MWSLTTPRGQVLPVPRLPAVLGSGGSADVRVPHESVAAEHARLSEGSAGTLRVEALADDAIVGVGGKRVPRALLRDGDELVLGRVKFILRAGTNDAAAASTPRDPRATPAAAATAALPPSSPSSASLVSRASPDPRGSLEERLAARRPPLAAAPASAAEPELVHRGKSLQFGKVAARRGLLNADLSQLSAGLRLLLVAGGLLLAVGLMYGVMKLFGLFA